MNCLDYRRRVQVDPDDPGGALRAHAERCPACARFARRVAKLERTIRAAARVAPPENLGARILMRQSFVARPRRPAHRRAWPAIAAGTLLLVLAALGAMRYLYLETELGRELVALVEAADHALDARGPVPDRRVAHAPEPVGLSVSTPLAELGFAGRCLVRGELSGHLVLRDASRPVTVFLMPQRRLVRRARFEIGAWKGLLVPAGRGSIGIVAPPGVHIDRVAARVLQAVSWRA